MLKSITFAPCNGSRLGVLGRDGSDVNVINSWSVCPECGNLYYTTSLEENCALCLTPASLFFLFQ
ncbi:hypothetical protein [uncultured Rikenella sp.]|uniref:hypothetical protein n=1 Tax=uncultured Rikenella sp. TaxID=368003 RepID=UPI0026102F83|nr:hypothetical protein [uncultured Rikenella sp.]